MRSASFMGLPPGSPLLWTPALLTSHSRTIKIAEISAGSLVFPGKYWYLQYNCVAWTPCHMQAERGMVPVNPPKIRTSTEEEA